MPDNDQLIADFKSFGFDINNPQKLLIIEFNGSTRMVNDFDEDIELFLNPNI